MCLIFLVMNSNFSTSVGRLEDVEKIAKVTNCLKLYIVKGIALGCFVYARCLYKGYGVEKNEENAIHWFKRVSYAYYALLFSAYLLRLSGHALIGYK